MTAEPVRSRSFHVGPCKDPSGIGSASLRIIPLGPPVWGFGTGRQ